MFYKLIGRDFKPNDAFENTVSLFRDKFNGVLVSTVFLGMDHNFYPHVRIPILFETMIFGGEHDGYMIRYSDYDSAEIGHKETCDMVDRIRIERDSKIENILDEEV